MNDWAVLLQFFGWNRFRIRYRMRFNSVSRHSYAEIARRNHLAHSLLGDYHRLLNYVNQMWFTDGWMESCKNGWSWTGEAFRSRRLAKVFGWIGYRVDLDEELRRGADERNSIQRYSWHVRMFSYDRKMKRKHWMLDLRLAAFRKDFFIELPRHERVHYNRLATVTSARFLTCWKEPVFF